MRRELFRIRIAVFFRPLDSSRRSDNRNVGISSCAFICTISNLIIYSGQGGCTMLSHKNTKNANFLFILDMLKDLLARGLITDKEYDRAKRYYMKLTGADIVLAS